MNELNYEKTENFLNLQKDLVGLSAFMAEYVREQLQKRD